MCITYVMTTIDVPVSLYHQHKHQHLKQVRIIRGNVFTNTRVI